MKPDLFRDRPDLTAALRQATWEFKINEQGFTGNELVSRVQRARREMGLSELKGGAPISLIQRRVEGSPQQNKALPTHYLVKAEKVEKQTIPQTTVGPGNGLNRERSSS